MGTLNKENKTITLSSGKWGIFLTAIIILARAFQPNAIPLSQWSFLSWLLIFLPILWPFYIYLVAKLLYVISNIILYFIQKH